VKLHGRIHVEQLDDERLTNIERKVVAGAADRLALPVRAPRRYLAFAAAALAACVAGVIGWNLRGGEVAPIAVEPAQVAVHTDAKGSTLDIGDARIDSAPDTAFIVTRPAGGVLVEMTRGKVELSVGKRGDRPPLVVRAGDTDVVVVGTKFTVDYGDGTHGVDVQVTEGVVKVASKKLETRVAAGQHWRSSEGLVAVAEPVTPEAPVVPAKPAAVPDVHLHDRVAAVPDPAKPVTPPAAAVAIRDVRPRPAHVVEAREPRDLKAEIISQPVEPPLDIGVRDVNEAMSRYRITVLGEKNEGAATALYSMAVLQHLKLGRDGDALRSVDAYERAYPAGREIRSALWLRLRILCRVAIDEQCRQAAVTYQRKAVEGPALHVAQRITKPQ
jgi:FecR protein